MRWKFWRRITLLVMRLDDMVLVHPDMDYAHSCCRCSEPVGIYPSGQNVIRRYGKRVDIICSVCQPPHPASALAPGALSEFWQSVRRN